MFLSAGFLLPDFVFAIAFNPFRAQRISDLGSRAILQATKPDVREHRGLSRLALRALSARSPVRLRQIFHRWCLDRRLLVVRLGFWTCASKKRWRNSPRWSWSNVGDRRAIGLSGPSGIRASAECERDLLAAASAVSNLEPDGVALRRRFGRRQRDRKPVERPSDPFACGRVNDEKFPGGGCVG